MKAQFIFSTARAAGVSLRAVINNSLNSSTAEQVPLREKGLRVSIKIFQEGKLLRSIPDHASVALNESFDLNEDSIRTLVPNENPALETLIVATCAIGEEFDERYFSQEHQIVYSSRTSNFSASVLYEQQPLSPRQGSPRPIVLIAPKCWISESIDSYTAVCNASPRVENSIEMQSMEFSLLDSSGTLVNRKSISFQANGAFLLSGKSLLPESHRLSAKPEFFTVCAKGGASTFAISTLVVNRKSGSFALEHSLSPHYYLGGDLARARQTALTFGHREVMQ
jgi:hypothetical protein